eukprot:1284340-Rhodomonas_salina.4
MLAGRSRTERLCARACFARLPSSSKSWRLSLLAQVPLSRSCSWRRQTHISLTLALSFFLDADKRTRATHPTSLSGVPLRVSGMMPVGGRVASWRAGGLQACNAEMKGV